MAKLSLDVRTREGTEHPILLVSGEIDVFTAPLFKQAVLEMTDQGARELFLDMREVTFMDSSGLGALLEATRRLRQLHGSLHLIGCNNAIQRMLHLTRLDTLITIHSTTESHVSPAAGAA